MERRSKGRKTGRSEPYSFTTTTVAASFRKSPEQAGFTVEGWAQGVCVGDYNNDGKPDVLVTYYGHNRLYRNLGNGKFADATAEAHMPVTGVRYGSGCTFLDYDRDGWLDLFVSNYTDLDLAKTPKPGQDPSCVWKGTHRLVRAAWIAHCH